jgi:hypothetical protein
MLVVYVGVRISFNHRDRFIANLDFSMLKIMKFRNFKSLLIAAFLISALGERASAQFTTTPLRIMTLGDSITAGFRYQTFLRTKLVTEGANFTFVGSRGTDPNKNEGWSGYNVVGLSNKVNTWLTDANANVVMLQVGINDMGHGNGVNNSKDFPPYTGTGPSEGPRPGATLKSIAYNSDLYQSVPRLLDQILNHPNAPTLIVAKIPGVGLGNALRWPQEYNDAESRVKEYNAILEAAVKTRQDSGKKIRLVNNNALGSREYGTGPEYIWGSQSRQAGDWVHPDENSAGYERMATNFFNGLKDALGVPASTVVDHTLETGTMTARGQSAPDQSVAQAFDNNLDTKWFDSLSTTSWIQFEFASARIVNRYVLTSGSDMPDRDPKNWTFQGSNDGIKFEDLNAQAEQTFNGYRKFPKAYDFVNGTGYKIYRLNITQNNGNPTGTQLSELRLWGLGASNPGGHRKD